MIPVDSPAPFVIPSRKAKRSCRAIDHVRREGTYFKYYGRIFDIPVRDDLSNRPTIKSRNRGHFRADVDSKADWRGLFDPDLEPTHRLDQSSLSLG